VNAVTAETQRPPKKALPAQMWNRHLVAIAALTLVLIPAPVVLPEAQQAVAVRVLIFALMSIGWNVMSGFGGMFSFGHAAYFGLGAYTSAWLLVNHHVSPWIGMLAGMVVAAAFAVLVGFLSLRYKLKGAYFALATFAFAEILRLWAGNSDFVNRAVGYHVPLRPKESWWYLQFDPGSPNYFFIALALTVTALTGSVLFLRSGAGQFTLAIRDDQDAASALGIAVMRHKLQTMAFSAAITSVAGAFYVQYYLFIDPDLAFGASASIQAILPAVIGGVGTIWGPVVGALVLGPLSDVIATVLRNPPEALSFLQGRGGLDVIVYGVILIVIILLLPQGIYAALRKRWSHK
jgi:branched-chain amino acid transport system permease protein